MNSFLIFFVVQSLFASAPLLQDEKNNVEIYHNVNPSVVNITSVTLKRDFFFDVVPQTGVGSGAFIKTEGFILTNDHVVANARKLEVTLFDKSSFPASLVGTDPDTDLAVLKIDLKGKKVPALKFGKADSLNVGQKVLAIGNPFGLGGSLSVGIISSLERDIRTPSEGLIKDVIQTDAAINPGNSGGPLLDSGGNLIGVNTQILSTTGGSVGVGFAISVKTASKIADQLIAHGKVLRPDLGLYGVGLPTAILEALKIPTPYGIMVTKISKVGPAGRAGLKSADQEVALGFRILPYGGDVIFRVDDIPVSTMRDILDYVYEKKPGDSVVLHYYRGNKRFSKQLKLSIPEHGSSF